MAAKIKLKVKSGNGLIVGIDEVDVVDGYADFSNIQFTEPGEYIITAIPIGISDFDETDFSVYIEKQEEIIAQDNNGTEPDNTTGTRPIIAQIVQPTINLPPMRYPVSSNSVDDLNIGSSLGFVPFVWYNGVQIAIKDVMWFELSYNDLAPICKVTIIDSLGLVNSPDRMPTNDTKFEIFLNSGSSNLKSIHLRFKISNYQVNRDKSITMVGLLDVDELYQVSYKAYNGTSMKVLTEISTQMNLGYNSNITDTNDSMKWLRVGSRTVEYISQIITHSFISDESFLVGYIDFYWCFNYIDVEKEWRRDISNDYGINSHGITSIGDSEKLVKLVLTNEPSFNTSSLFFTNFKLNNNSTLITTNSGTLTKVRYYERLNKSFVDFNIDAQSSDTYTMEILKSPPQKSNNLVENYISYFGGSVDIENVHKNYVYALTQNDRNFKNLVNVSATIDLLNPNYNIYRYQKVNIMLVNEKQTPSNENIIDERMSGEWIVLNIAYLWRNASLIQRLTIVRKELSKTKEEIKNQSVQPIKEETSINENPQDELVVINDYSIGQVINVIDEKKQEFVITVNGILGDGKHITGNITEVLFEMPPNDDIDSIYATPEIPNPPPTVTSTPSSPPSSNAPTGATTYRSTKTKFPGNKVNKGNLEYYEYHITTPGKTYFTEKNKKQWIVLHHTAGSENPFRVANTFNSRSIDEGYPISTEFSMGGVSLKGESSYDGVLVQCHPDGYWAYHSSSGRLDRTSVGIEVCNYGYLREINGKLYTASKSNPRVMDPAYAIRLSQPFRKRQYYHNYTERQIISLKKFLLYIANRDNIDLRAGLRGLIQSKGAFGAFDTIVGGPKVGIWSHTNTTLGKSDMYPHPMLIDMLMSL
jgi:hypothetical protein